MVRAAALKVLVLAACLAPRAAAAQEAEGRLDQAVRLHNAGRFRQAIQVLRRGIEESRDPKFLSRLHLQIGINQAILGRDEQARAAFVAALRHDPTVTVNLEVVKPSIVTLFRQVRERLRGRLLVPSAAARGTVLIDGRPSGAPPLETSLPIGLHRVELQSAGGRLLASVRVLVAVGQPSEVHWPDLHVETQPARVAGATEKDQVAAEPRPARRIWTWVTAGSAVACASVGLGLWLWGRAGYSEYSATTDPVRFDELKDSVPPRYIAADVMLGVAAGLAVTSVVLFFVEPRRAARPAVSSKSTARWLPPAPGSLLRLAF